MRPTTLYRAQLTVTAIAFGLAFVALMRWGNLWVAWAFEVSP